MQIETINSTKINNVKRWEDGNALVVTITSGEEEENNVPCPAETIRVISLQTEYIP